MMGIKGISIQTLNVIKSNTRQNFVAIAYVSHSGYKEQYENLSSYFVSLISLIPCFYSTNKFSRMETSKNTSYYNDKMNLKIFRTIEIKNLFLEVTKLVESTKHFWFVFFKPLAFFEPVLWILAYKLNFQNGEEVDAFDCI